MPSHLPPAELPDFHRRLMKALQNRRRERNRDERARFRLPRGTSNPKATEETKNLLALLRRSGATDLGDPRMMG